MPLGELERLNGRPLSFQSFTDEGAGLLANAHGGRLSGLINNRCLKLGLCARNNVVPMTVEFLKQEGELLSSDPIVKEADSCAVAGPTGFTRPTIPGGPDQLRVCQ